MKVTQICGPDGPSISANTRTVRNFRNLRIGERFHEVKTIRRTCPPGCSCYRQPYTGKFDHCAFVAMAKPVAAGPGLGLENLPELSQGCRPLKSVPPTCGFHATIKPSRVAKIKIARPDFPFAGLLNIKSAVPPVLPTTPVGVPWAPPSQVRAQSVRVAGHFRVARKWRIQCHCR